MRRLRRTLLTTILAAAVSVNGLTGNMSCPETFYAAEETAETIFPMTWEIAKEKLSAIYAALLPEEAHALFQIKADPDLLRLLNYASNTLLKADASWIEDLSIQITPPGSPAVNDNSKEGSASGGDSLSRSGWHFSVLVNGVAVQEGGIQGDEVYLFEPMQGRWDNPFWELQRALSNLRYEVNALLFTDGFSYYSAVYLDQLMDCLFKRGQFLPPLDTFEKILSAFDAVQDAYVPRTYETYGLSDKIGGYPSAQSGTCYTGKVYFTQELITECAEELKRMLREDDDLRESIRAVYTWDWISLEDIAARTYAEGIGAEEYLTGNEIPDLLPEDDNSDTAQNQSASGDSDMSWLGEDVAGGITSGPEEESEEEMSLSEETAVRDDLSLFLQAEPADQAASLLDLYCEKLSQMDLSEKNLDNVLVRMWVNEEGELYAFELYSPADESVEIEERDCLFRIANVQMDQRVQHTDLNASDAWVMNSSLLPFEFTSAASPFEEGRYYLKLEGDYFEYDFSAQNVQLTADQGMTGKLILSFADLISSDDSSSEFRNLLPDLQLEVSLDSADMRLTDGQITYLTMSRAAAEDAAAQPAERWPVVGNERKINIPLLILRLLDAGMPQDSGKELFGSLKDALDFFRLMSGE